MLTWVWESVTKSLKTLIREKNIHIKEQDLAREIEDLELIEESMWRTILKDMYDEQDIHKIEQMITLKHNQRKQKLQKNWNTTPSKSPVWYSKSPISSVRSVRLEEQ